MNNPACVVGVHVSLLSMANDNMLIAFFTEREVYKLIEVGANVGSLAYGLAAAGTGYVSIVA